MAKLTGAAAVFDIDTSSTGSASVITSPQLGTRARDTSGNEYIFLSGTASTALGDFVTWNSSFATTRALNTTTGPLAVAGTAILLNQVGWYQLYGFTPATTNIATDASANGKALYTSSTAGRATTTSAAGTIILGATASGAAASNAGIAVLDYPYAMGTSVV